MNLFLTIALVAIHPNPGHHFAQFGKVFEQEGIPYVAFAADNALIKMSPLKAVVPINTHMVEETADKIAKVADEVLLDVGPLFSFDLAKALKARNVKVIAYVDNYEGCNKLAAEIVSVADKALYVKELGYYPLEDIERIQALRQDEDFKQSFIAKHQLSPELPILLFIGSADKDYENIFKTFLSENNEGLAQYNLLLHRHPRAEEEGITDKIDLLYSNWKTPFAISTGTLEQAMAVADVMGYNKTTTAIKGPLLGIPTFQWGSSLKTKNDLEAFFASPSHLSSEEALQLVGYRPDWQERLVRFTRSEMLTPHLSEGNSCDNSP